MPLKISDGAPHRDGEPEYDSGPLYHPLRFTSRLVAEKTLAPAVGDVNSSAKGTGARFNAGKAPLDMIPLHLLEGAARVFQKATTRPVNPYPKYNWAKGMPWSVPIGCLKRHLAAMERGEDLDADSGELHVDHMMCNLLMLIHYYQAFKEGDDRSELFRKPDTDTGEQA